MSAETSGRASSTASVAYEALNKANANAQAMESHEDLCAERYGNIHKSIDEIKGILKWAGLAGFSIIISLLGYLASAQFTANDAARQQADSKIELLERQLRQQPPAIVAPSSHP